MRYRTGERCPQCDLSVSHKFQSRKRMANLSRSTMGCFRTIGGNLKTQAQVRTAAKSSAPLRSSSSSFSFSIRTDNPRRLFSITRLPVELGCCVESLIPLHSAVASARLTSRLSINSRSLSQGTLCRTSPDRQFLFCIAVAYSAPQRHGCLKIVENNYCASKRGGVRCLATLNVSFAAVFVLLALFLGSTILTLESDCTVTLFWCYEVVCWGLAVIFGGTAFFLRRKAAVILDEGGYYGSHTVGLEMLEAAPQLPQAEIEKRVNAGFSSWMGSSFLSSDEEDGPQINGLDDIWEDEDAYSMPINTGTALP